MALGPLAAFVSDLISQPFTTGLQKRKNFNQDPSAILGSAGIAGDDLGAFLAFTKGDIANQALDDLTAGDIDLSTPDDVRDFSIWLYDFGRWDFDPTEEKEYVGTFPPGGKPAQYGKPQCQIRQVAVTNTVAQPGGKQKASLDIYGEGFLKTKTTVNIFTDKGQPAGSQQTEPVDKSASEKSTFRGGLLQLQTLLDPGNYYALVSIDLGNGGGFVIGTPASGAFTVP